ncbi:hypothetical protein Hamer_G005305 [Homarus americanus]|uniref:Uncharacterized protein n=1 Tax=Homarus americanus TaxID=6706 RepID=A0A8J5MX77_HOMAM|nr:hypothetical protein Hamer_G005305 [Homarus americanus]
MKLLALLLCLCFVSWCAGQLVYSALPYPLLKTTAVLHKTQAVALTDEDKISTTQVFTGHVPYVAPVSLRYRLPVVYPHYVVHT